ncbi:MAG: hypothetical protein GY884_21670, partial [Proteobacteria bacterium]|nr:hypothetical protein [Pseudomonadota bacterium]
PGCSWLLLAAPGCSWLLLAALAIGVGLAVSIRIIKEARYRQLEQARGHYALRAGHWTHTLLVVPESAFVQVIRVKGRPPRSEAIARHMPSHPAGAILARSGDGAPVVVPESYRFVAPAGRLFLSLNARHGLARTSVFLICHGEAA